MTTTIVEWFAIGLVAALLVAGPASAEVYYSKDEALELAFGTDATIEPQSVFLSDEQAAEIERVAKAKLDSKLFTFHVGKKNGKVLGYAAIESHTVRTQPEALLVVLNPAGDLTRTEILAFHEPPEYQPPARWFERLYGRSVDGLVLGQGIDGIAGATMSSRAALDSIRKVMSIYRLALKPEAD
jgi:hypothetical protein